MATGQRERSVDQVSGRIGLAAVHSKVAGSTNTGGIKKKNIFLFINHHDGYFFDDWVSVVATSSSAAMHRSSEWLLFQR